MTIPRGVSYGEARASEVFRVSMRFGGASTKAFITFVCICTPWLPHVQDMGGDVAGKGGEGVEHKGKRFKAGDDISGDLEVRTYKNGFSLLLHRDHYRYIGALWACTRRRKLRAENGTHSVKFYRCRRPTTTTQRYSMLSVPYMLSGRVFRRQITRC